MFKDVFSDLLQTNNITISQLSKITGIPQPTLSHYKSGRQKPSFENLVKLCSYFNVSTDFFLNSDEKKEILQIPLPERIEIISKALICTYESLDNENRQLMIDATVYFSDYLLLISDLKKMEEKEEMVQLIYNLSRTMHVALEDLSFAIKFLPRKNYKELIKKKDELNADIEDMQYSVKKLFNTMLKNSKFDISI